MTTLLRPEGLVNSPVFSHVAVVPPGATTVYIGGQNAVDGDGHVVGAEAYPVAAATLAGAAPLVTVQRVAGLVVPGALLEVSAIAAVTS